MRRLTQQKNEFEVFYYTFQAAQVLFREEEKKEDQPDIDMEEQK
jgi:hypothetical protein